MSKNEFKLKLYEELEGISTSEKSRILDYFDELIADAVDDGKDEEIFINSLGDVKAIINKVKAEQRIKYAKENPGISSGAKALIAALTLCTLPLSIPLGLAVVGIVISVFATVIGVIGGVFGLVFGGIGIGIGGIGSVFGIFGSAIGVIVSFVVSIIKFPFYILNGVFSIGSFFISIGIAILLIVILLKFTGVCLKIIGSILNAITGKIYDKRGN